MVRPIASRSSTSSPLATAKRAARDVVVVEAGVVVLARPADEPHLDLLVAAEQREVAAPGVVAHQRLPLPGRAASPSTRSRSASGSRNVGHVRASWGASSRAALRARVEVLGVPAAGRGVDDRAVGAVDERVGAHGRGHRGDRRRAVGRRVVERVRVAHGGVAAARRQPLGLEGGQAGEHGEADPQPGERRPRPRADGEPRRLHLGDVRRHRRPPGGKPGPRGRGRSPRGRAGVHEERRGPRLEQAEERGAQLDAPRARPARRRAARGR